MNRKDIESMYDVEDDFIITPGKFEGEPVYAPYFWDFVLNGFSDREEISKDDTSLSFFDINGEDIGEFPMLTDCHEVLIYEDSQGFVHCEVN